MRPRAWILGVLIVAAAGAAAAVLADEKTEHVQSALRHPRGEWIKSVDADPVDIWAFGDAYPPRARQVMRIVRRTNPERIIYLGDVYPRGTSADFRRWAQPFGRRYLGRMAPTPGNHEWKLARRGYEPFWRGVTGRTPPSYYSFRAGAWTVLSVNGEHSDREALEAWLRSKTASGGDCRIVFWHRPAFTAGHHEGNDPRAQAYYDVVRGRARIVVNGHDHNMQRMREDAGTVQFISGAVGRRIYPVDESNGRLEFSDDSHRGALRLLLSGTEAEWRFVAANGEQLDSGMLRCEE